MDLFFIEVTDTFGGEANYCWVRRYLVTAKSQLGAIQKLSRHEGYSFRFDGLRYNAKGACVCAFVDYADDVHYNEYLNVTEL